MIKFNFTVNETDAENIMSLMQAGVAKQNEYILDAILDGTTEEETWHRKHKAYLIELIAKMKHESV